MKSLIVTLTFLALLQCSFCTFGIDVSQLFSAENYTCAKNNGITFAIARGYCSFGGMDKNVVQSLRNMKAGGLKTDTYMFPCRGKNATTQVNQMVSNIPTDLYSRIWIDIETNPSSGCSWADHNGTSNCEYTLELVKAIKAKGKTVGIYASRYMWANIMGSQTACPQASFETPLWYAHYDNVPSFTDFVEFANWKTPNIKQYHGTESFCGASIDRSWMP